MKAVCYQEMPVHEIYNFISSFTGEQIQATGTSTATGNAGGFNLPEFNFSLGGVTPYLINAGRVILGIA